MQQNNRGFQEELYRQMHPINDSQNQYDQPSQYSQSQSAEYSRRHEYTGNSSENRFLHSMGTSKYRHILISHGIGFNYLLKGQSDASNYSPNLQLQRPRGRYLFNIAVWLGL